MKNIFKILGIFSWTFLSSCTINKSYMSNPAEVDIGIYGSFIKVFKTNTVDYNGELIAVDDKQLIVLTDEIAVPTKNYRVVTIKFEDIYNYQLYYAKAANLAPAIPLLAILSLTHGLYATGSAPTNIIITSLIAHSQTKEFQINKKEMSYSMLKKFARFPQGLPPNIDINKLSH